MGSVIINETFANGLDNWWTEGLERVWVEDNRIWVQSEGEDNQGGSGTVWCKTPHPANFVLEYDAHVKSSCINVNNINVFFCFRGPGGKSLYATRQERSTGRYKLYHELDGYIITYLNDAKAEGGLDGDGNTRARNRMRREPGFELVLEKFDHHCRPGITYHFKITKKGGLITFDVDGDRRLSYEDPNPWGEGHLGLRTFKTTLWWSNIKVTAL